MFIVPRAGLEKIRDPHTHHFIPAAGLEVPDHDLFWHRLLSEGDVTIGNRPQDKPADDQGDN